MSDFPVANGKHVKMLLDHLMECQNRFCDEHPEIETIDAFMAVHNLHVVFVLSMEWELRMDTELQLFTRKLALDTFGHALESKPAFDRKHPRGGD